MKTYHIKLDDGRITDVQANCAADVISVALWANRGHRVVRCFKGELAQPRGYSGGSMDFDVPKHEAIPHDAVKSVRRKPKDHSEVMPFMQEVSQ